MLTNKFEAKQKIIRNALKNNKVLIISDKFVKQLNLPGNKVKWEYIKKLVHHDFERVLKVAPHLKSKHIDVVKFL